MCGICGFTLNRRDRQQAQPLLEKMCRLLDHRGPDDQGTFFDRHVALGHRRLSIIDLSPAGHQPMSTPDEQIWITFNGEIYNFLELRQELERRGCRFRTRSDTEVILQAYEFFGADCVNHLNGMFAFAIWDQRCQKLLLARDRLGKKPLYYYQSGEEFIFASEMKALLAAPEVPRELDFAALNFYLTDGYIPAPWSIFKQIRKVREASFLIYQNGKTVEQGYWDHPENAPHAERSEQDYAEELESLLIEAVRCRMISDVPLGAFLSGGVDSSAIVAMMVKSANRVKTFTIDFPEEKFSELEDARRVASYCQTEHQVLQVKTDAVQSLPKLIWHFDEPFADSSAIPTYCVSQMAREQVTVILSGDGGDELFAGYMNYRKRNEYHSLLCLPSSLRRLTFSPLAQHLPLEAPARNVLKYLASASPDDGPAALGLYPYIKDDVLAEPFRRELQKYATMTPRQHLLAQFKTKDKLTRLQLLDTKLYLPGDILVKVDRMSMANSLETRAPLLDYRLVEFAARLPAHLKMRRGVSKYLLKKILQRHVPAENLTKRKHGFSVPLQRWFQTTLKSLAHEVLLDRRCRERGFLNSEVVQRVLKAHAEGPRDYSAWIWLLLNLELWFQTFVDSATRRI